MAPRHEDGSMLSVHRAFVVHLRANGGPRRARFAGRVEHLSSGRSALFSSLRGLLAFFAPVLDAGGRAPSGPDDPGTDGSARRPIRPRSSQAPAVDAPARRQSLREGSTSRPDAPDAKPGKPA